MAHWLAEYNVALAERDEREKGQKDLVGFFTRLADRYAELETDNTNLRVLSTVTIPLSPEDAPSDAAQTAPESRSAATPAATGLTRGYTNAAVSTAMRFTTAFLGSAIASGAGISSAEAAGVASAAGVNTKTPNNEQKGAAKVTLNADHAHRIAQLRSDLSAAQAIREKYEGKLKQLEESLEDSARQAGMSENTIRRLRAERNQLRTRLGDRTMELERKNAFVSEIQQQMVALKFQLASQRRS